ncbi:MAG: metallophosphoesterase family protein [Solirubrobacteraceae bacterium]|nr:metallophosphoesterase family protein [Solirubrobacteraceae bacterium]
MRARPMTRRTVVRGAAGAVVGSTALGPLAASTGAADAGLYLGAALEPELVTVTDRSMVAWWWTEEATDTTIRITPVAGGPTRELRLEERRHVHVATVDGLEPGAEYRYELLSGGRRMGLGSGPADPGAFRTLVPPSGRKLATIALLNDLHIGEHCSGTLFNLPGGVSVPPCFDADTYPDYAHRMADAAIGELSAHDLDLVIANGDLTDRGRPDDVARALRQLRRLSAPLLVTRGNHDRRLVGECGPDHDCLRSQAFPGNAVGDGTLRSVARVGRRLGVVGLDSNDPDTGAARILGDQPAWLDAQLDALKAEGRDAIVALHHPLLKPIQGVPADEGADALLAVLARHDHVRIVLHGHTHANDLTTHGPTGPLRFLENGAIKNYPCGYALLHVHEDGIMRTFHRPVNDWTRMWTATTARETWGLQPTALRGDLTSRAFVLRYDSRFGPGDPIDDAVADSPGGRAKRIDLASVRRVGNAKLRRRGVVVGVHSDVDADVTVRIVARLGRGDGVRRPRTVTLARVRRRSAAGTVRLRLRPTASQRLVLGRLTRAVSARVEVEARPRGGGAVRRARRPLRVLGR